jgi:Domain of unknown function (DUF4424)
MPRFSTHRRFGQTLVFVVLLLLMSTLLGSSAFADDGAASIAAGGIVMIREPRITMHKEVLRISAEKVSVDYEFRNDTDADITTEIAFPVPAYSLDWDRYTVSALGFDDFHLSIEGEPVHFSVEAKAKLKGKDVSTLLNKYGIDISTFGHFNERTHYAKDIRRLSTPQRAILVHAGLIDPETNQDEANWSVEKKYYWLQAFPAHTTIHVHHEYTPVLGSSNNTFWFEQSASYENDKTEGAKSFCADPTLLKILKPLSQRRDRILPLLYVDFILTTANTWKQPIEDFTLIVERPHERGSLQTFVSFCWDGPVTKLDDDHFSAHIVDFIPKNELHIGFVEVDSWIPDK